VRSSLDLSFGTFVSSKDQAVTVSISSTTSKVGDSYTTPVDMTRVGRLWVSAAVPPADVWSCSVGVALA
ncbi:hypothetical protein, partial [Dactylosporangium maewongense]|uniref:hypothetical protein n=1 Tax=Dactylosporangium maewongense TaxID=634393 RepID=UPI0031D6A9DC